MYNLFGRAFFALSKDMSIKRIGATIDDHIYYDSLLRWPVTWVKHNNFNALVAITVAAVFKC